MSGATFDTGMLIALDRDERVAWILLRRLVNRGEVPTVPTVVVGQAWRDGRRQARLARALAACRMEPLGDRLARQAGELCGRAGTSDIVDAIVVQSAGLRAEDVYTSDAADLGRLAGFVETPIAIIATNA